jgi:FemAB-related protein (PEP-CTERM system-associated)
MKIRSIEPGEHTAWDTAVATLPGGSFCHLSGWRAVIEQNFAFEGHLLIAEDAGGIVGGLPLYHVKRWPFPSALISSPACVYGGTFAAESTVHDKLAEAAIDLGRKLKVDYVELRDQSITRESWSLNDLYYTFRKPLPAPGEDTLLAIPTKQRAEVRKGIKAGLTFATSASTDEFYPVYSTSNRNLGSPGFRPGFYASLLKAFAGQAEVATAYHDGMPVSSVINFYFADQVLLYYGGGLEVARDLRSTQYLYWQVMNHALERGAQIFDFGRSMHNTGAYNFKRYWKFDPQPLHYHYYPVEGALPDLHPDKPVYSLAARAWAKLPLPVHQRLGPLVARAIV